MNILYSTIQGEGKDLLILHGFLGMGDNWRTHGQKIAQLGFRVHLIDQRNHGRSFWSDEFTYEDMGEDLNRYMVHHQITEAVILGHSMGGKTAMTFVAEQPERCNKLIVIDIAPKYYPPHHQPIVEALQALDLGSIGSRTEADEILARDIPEASIRLWLLKNLYRETPEQFGFRFNLEVLAENLDEVGEPLSGTAQFTKPTLFLRGEFSEYVRDSDIADIRMYFPEAQIETIPNAGHWLHAENPQGFMNVLESFLERG